MELARLRVNLLFTSEKNTLTPHYFIYIFKTQTIGVKATLRQIEG